MIFLTKHPKPSILLRAVLVFVLVLGGTSGILGDLPHAYALCAGVGQEIPAVINSVTASLDPSQNTLTVTVNYDAGGTCTGGGNNINWDAIVVIDSGSVGNSPAPAGTFSGSGVGWQNRTFSWPFNVSSVSNGTYTAIAYVGSSVGDAVPVARTYTIDNRVTTGIITVSSNIPATWDLSGPTPQSQSAPAMGDAYNSEEEGVYTVTAYDVPGYSPAQIRVNGALLGTGTASFTLSAGNTAGVSFTYVLIPASCGNGILEAGEACDNGAANGVCPALCSASCTANVCGGGGGGGGGTHNACIGNSCIVVAGPGVNQCNPPGSLCGATHNACVDPGTGPVCTVVAGAGANECLGIGTACVPPGAGCTLTAIPSLIYRYQYSTLAWNCDASLSGCSIDQGIGAVSNSGSNQVNPSTRTTYTIVCTGGGGGTASAQVTVNTLGIFEDNPHP